MIISVVGEVQSGVVFARFQFWGDVNDGFNLK